MSEIEIPKEELNEFAQSCRHLLGYYGLPGGWPPGGFTSALIGVWEKADLSNRARLSLAFPVLGKAVDLFSAPDGGEKLQRFLGERS